MKKFNNKKNNRRRNQEQSTPVRSMSTNKYYRPKNTHAATQPRVSSVKSPRKLTLAGLINTSIGAALFIVIFLASTLSTVPAITIQNFAPEYRDTAAYVDFATDYMQRSPISQSKLLFRSTDFEQSMIQEFPEIDQISAVIPLGGRKLDVNMSLSIPLALVMSGLQKGVIDSTGSLVSSDIDSLLLSRLSDSLPSLRFSTPQENFSAGSTLLTSTEVELLQLIISELQNSSTTFASSDPLQVSEFLFNVSDGQLEVRFANQPFYAKFSIYADVRLQVGTMMQTFKQLDREGQLPASSIDVRVPGKVYIN